MKLKEFLLSQYNIDITDNGSKQANDIKNSLGFYSVSNPFEKELNQLTDDEVYAVFVALIANKIWLYSEILDKGKKLIANYQ